MLFDVTSGSRYTDLAEEAEDNLRMILKWAELPS